MAVFPLSVYLLWIHQLILGILGAFIPSIVASFLVLRYANLERYPDSRLGRYVSKYMTRTIEVVRFLGLLISWVGAWYQVPWVIGGGVLIVVLAWARGKIIP